MAETTTSGMPQTKVHEPGMPCWIDTASPDIETTKKFYADLFGWQIYTVEDPAAGGYAMAYLDDQAVAAMGPMQPGQFPAWNVYFATTDADETARKVEAAGGKVVAPPFDVLTSGRMAAFQDPAGAFFSVWQGKDTQGLGKMHEPSTFGWCELNAPGIAKVVPFYAAVFGWGAKTSPMAEGAPPYTEFQHGGKSIAGAMDTEGTPGMEQVPPNWLSYFLVTDVDAATKKATDLGAALRMAPQAYPGGKFSVVTDPGGATFGLMQQIAQ